MVDDRAQVWALPWFPVVVDTALTEVNAQLAP